MAAGISYAKLSLKFQVYLNYFAQNSTSNQHWTASRYIFNLWQLANQVRAQLAAMRVNHLPPPDLAHPPLNVISLWHFHFWHTVLVPTCRQTEMIQIRFLWLKWLKGLENQVNVCISAKIRSKYNITMCRDKSIQMCENLYGLK